MITPELMTDRLILRQIKEDDIKDIYDCWMKDEDVSRYMFWKSSDDINETKRFVEFELENIESTEWYRWIIVKNDTKEIIGTCLIFYNSEESAWDISYNLGKAYWGKGYITEAMKKVLDFADKELKIKSVIAVHAKENQASGKVIEKLGFKYVKDVSYDCNGDTIHTTGRYYELKL